MRWWAIALVALLAGCGSSPPREVARQWVEAINRGDHERACDLSTGGGGDDCPSVLAKAFPDGGLEIESAREQDDALAVDITTPRLRGETQPPAVEGWTAYGPLTVRVENSKVHFEVTLIR